jgi:hypothetical protein
MGAKNELSLHAIICSVILARFPSFSEDLRASSEIPAQISGAQKARASNFLDSAALWPFAMNAQNNKSAAYFHFLNNRSSIIIALHGMSPSQVFLI